jgi:hypothetical protein
MGFTIPGKSATVVAKAIPRVSFWTPTTATVCVAFCLTVSIGGCLSRRRPLDLYNDVGLSVQIYLPLARSWRSMQLRLASIASCLPMTD